MKHLLALTAAAALAACAAPAPEVTRFNGDSVEIETGKREATPTTLTNGEADRICGKAGKHAEYASTREVRKGNAHLYLCLDNAPSVAAQAATPAASVTPVTYIVK